jgi:predicted nucleic acid-binding protein
MSVIVNTTTISNFACIEQLNVLQQLYNNINISVEVYGEIQQGLEEGYQFYAPLEKQIYPIEENGWIKLTNMIDEQEFRFLRELPKRLHIGEASSLAIAHHRDWLFLTDDMAARKEAIKHGIRLSGTLGCLVLATERKICTLGEANYWLNKMIEQDYKSPINDLTSLIHS